MLGQPDFNTAILGTTQRDFNTPRNIFSDGERLFIAERNNNRVVIYNSIPTSNYAPADVVIGQPDFDTSSWATTQSKFYGPHEIYFDGKLFISDGFNSRILIYNSIPTTNGAPADIVIGQPDFNTRTSGTTSQKFSGPYGVYSDGKRMFVTDMGNHRVLIYNSIPTSNYAPADIVIGQPDFTTKTSGTTQRKLYGPLGLFCDGKRLFVGEYNNRRVLIYYLGPQNSSFSINNNALYADAREVGLSLSSQGAYQMLISESSNFSGASWQTYSSSPTFTLSDGEGEKTLYLKLRDQAEFETETFSQKITYDVSPPSAVTISNLPSSWANSNPTLTFTATDVGSGIDRYEININDGGFNPVSATYTPNLPSGTHTLQVKAYDKSGKVSSASSDKLYLDLEPPTFKLSQPSLDKANKTTTDTGSIVLAGKAQDQKTLSGLKELYFTVNNSQTKWKVNLDKAGYFHYTIINLRKGESTIHFKLADKAGNLTSFDFKVENTGFGPPITQEGVEAEGEQAKVLPLLAYMQQTGKPLTITIGNKTLTLQDKQSLQITDKSPLALAGQIYPNAQITLFIQSKEQTLITKADEKGYFSITLPKLKVGTHNIYSQVTLNDYTTEKEHLLTLSVKPAWYSFSNIYFDLILALFFLTLVTFLVWFLKKRRFKSKN